MEALDDEGPCPLGKDEEQAQECDEHPECQAKFRLEKFHLVNRLRVDYWMKMARMQTMSAKNATPSIRAAITIMLLRMSPVDSG